MSSVSAFAAKNGVQPLQRDQIRDRTGTIARSGGLGRNITLQFDTTEKNSNQISAVQSPV
jgi:hypothetical protein